MIQTISSNNAYVSNPGTAPSEPLIRVNCTGDITLMIRGQIIALLAVNSYITLDTALKEAYRSTALQNNKMVGEFPLLLPGNNSISWEGSVTNLQITPRWRNL